MPLRLGYVGVNTGLPSPSRTLRLATMTPERVLALVRANLDALAEILRWNAAHGIEVFRITSALVPLGSHPRNDVAWWQAVRDRFDAVAELVGQLRPRLSMHPGQYTVLSSPDPRVVASSVADLEYHARLLALLGLDPEHKIVIHPGGTYGDRLAAGRRFARTYRRLPQAIRDRLVLENDERWSLEETLGVAEPLAIPAVLDVFHHAIRPSFSRLSTRELALRAGETWRPSDGRQEVHFSTQAPAKRPGAHADSLDDEAFLAFYDAAGDLPIDCILEVKDKERSVLRAQQLIRARPAPTSARAPAY